MVIIKKPGVLRSFLQKTVTEQKKIGFVPTMGALHAGHISLINASLNFDDITVCSIFINPTQFNDPADFKKYPVTIEKDIQMLENTGCQLLFLPAMADIYPEGLSPLPEYNLGFLDTILEGKFRPGHFQGVCQVVHRLLDMVNPDNLYLGQKDYQQCMVIKKLVQLIGLIERVDIVVCPTQREPDGLAMSSRNIRLTPDERKKAIAISSALHFVKNNLLPGNLSSLKTKAISMLKKSEFRVDYIEIADAETLQSVTQWDGHQKIVALAAAYINEIRLIDNLVLN